VVVLVALDEAEHQVSNVEGLTSHSMAMVPAQCLLVLGRVEEGDIAASSSWSMASSRDASTPCSSYALTLGAP